MKKYVAELLGTFVLIFAGVGTAVLAEVSIGLLGIACAFGLSLLAMVCYTSFWAEGTPAPLPVTVPVAAKL